MITLDGYQEVAVNWLLNQPRGILGDDPGVGKTYPAILAAKSLEGSKLVIAPAYLALTWQQAIEDCEAGTAVAIQGSKTGKEQLFLGIYDWYIISYQLFCRKDWMYRITQRNWSVVIFDEAHRLRGRKSVSTNAAFSLSKIVPRTWQLTGTPVYSNGGDIWPLLHICDSQHFRSYWKFVQENCLTVSDPWGMKVKGLKDKEGFAKLVQPYMLRRLLKEVQPDIPDAVERIIYTELDDKTKQAYKLAKREYKRQHPDGHITRINAAGLLSELRGLTYVEKLKTLLGILEDIPEHEQVVVYAWHKDLAEATIKLLEGQQYAVSGFTGDTAAQVRSHLIEEFKQGSFRILVATLATVQEGVNLQNASQVVFIEESYAGQANKQALARLVRRGQVETVIKTVIICKRTVDAAVHRTQERRTGYEMSSVFDEVMRESDN